MLKYLQSRLKKKNFLTNLYIHIYLQSAFPGSFLPPVDQWNNVNHITHMPVHVHKLWIIRSKERNTELSWLTYHYVTYVSELGIANGS